MNKKLVLTKFSPLVLQGAIVYCLIFFNRREINFTIYFLTSNCTDYVELVYIIKFNYSNVGH